MQMPRWRLRVWALLALVAVVAVAIKVWNILPYPKPLNLFVWVAFVLPLCLLIAYIVAAVRKHPNRKIIGVVALVVGVPLFTLLVLLYLILFLAGPFAAPG